MVEVSWAEAGYGLNARYYPADPAAASLAQRLTLPYASPAFHAGMAFAFATA